MDQTTDSGDDHWNKLAQFYSANKSVLEECIRLDVTKIDKRGKMSELDYDSFKDITQLVIEGLAILGSIHPVIGAAVSAFRQVFTLDMTRRDNDKRVRVIFLEIRNMLCTMFELRNYPKSDSSTRMDVLISVIAGDIMKCGSDLRHYTDRKFLPKMILAPKYANCFLEHGNTFAKHRSQLQLAITTYIGHEVGVTNAKLDQVDNKLDGLTEILEVILKKLETPREKEALKFIEEHGGAKTCISRNELLAKLYSMAHDSSPSDIDGSSISMAERLAKLQNDLNADLTKDFGDALKQNFSHFEQLLVVQGNKFERISGQLSTKLDNIARTQLMMQKDGRTIMEWLGPNVSLKLKDKLLQKIWDSMDLKSKKIVKAKHFVLTFRDHCEELERSTLSTPIIKDSAITAEPLDMDGKVVITNSPSTNDLSLVDADDKSDPLLLQYIDAAHVQPIVEALDKDGSGYISVEEANEFALSRPGNVEYVVLPCHSALVHDDLELKILSFSLLQWMVYWAAGWHINITNYRNKIYAILLLMHGMVPSIHPANRGYVDEYLNYFAIARVEGLLRSTKGLPENTPMESKLVGIAESICVKDEERLLVDLKALSFMISSPADASLIGGSARIETWIYPLLYLILNHHLSVFRLAKTHILHDEELDRHINSLYNIFQVFDKRMRNLEAIFSQMNRTEVSRHFETFSYGMFFTSYKKDTEIVPAKNTLMTFRDHDMSEIHVSESALERPKKNLFTFQPSKRWFTYTNQLWRLCLGDDSFVEDEKFDGTPHPLQGYWSGVYLLVDGQKTQYPGLLYGVFELISEQNISGLGNVFKEQQEERQPLKFHGEISETEDGYTNLKFTVHQCWDLLHGDTIHCTGRYDHAKDVIQGDWVRVRSESASSEVSPNADVQDNDDNPSKDTGTFHLTRTPAELSFYYRDILTSPQHNTMSLARRRWAFAVEAVRNQVKLKAQLDSWLFWCSGIEELENPVELRIRGKHLEAARKDHSFDLAWPIYPTRVEIRKSFEIYLIQRDYHFVGNYYCDSCGRLITFSRYQCIYCMKEDMSNQLDFCVERCCSQSLLLGESDFASSHHSSHTLLRSTHLLHKCELAVIIPQSRLRSERIKLAFRDSRTKAEVAKGSAQLEPSNIIGITKSSTPLVCICCDEQVSLPCWVCATCALDTIVCLECAQKWAPLPKNDTTTHSHDHPLLRIQDSDAFISGESRVEQQLQDINGKLVSLDQKLQAHLNEATGTGKAQALAQDISKNTPEMDVRLHVNRSLTAITTYGHADGILESTEVSALSETAGIDTTPSIEDDLSPLEPKITEPGLGHEDHRIIAQLEYKLDERMSKLETKVDHQFDLIHSLLQQLVSPNSTAESQSQLRR